MVNVILTHGTRNYVKKAMINVILTFETMKLCEEGDDQCDIDTFNHEIM